MKGEERGKRERVGSIVAVSLWATSATELRDEVVQFCFAVVAVLGPGQRLIHRVRRGKDDLLEGVQFGRHVLLERKRNKTKMALNRMYGPIFNRMNFIVNNISP